MTEIAANKGVKREERILKNGAYAHEPVQWHRRDRPCDVGAPHQRKRVFIVAYADGDGRNAEQFQSGKSGETLDKAPKREFGGTGWLYGGIPDANGYGVEQFGEQKEIEKLEDEKITSEDERKKMQSGGGGKLNPTWVEWLQGVPIGWTDLEV